MSDQSLPQSQQADANSAAQQPEPVLKKIEVKVPDEIPAAIVQVAADVGLAVMSQVQMGRVVLNLPELQVGEDGRPVASVQHYAVLVIDEKDIGKLLSLAQAINKANIAIIKQKKAGNPIDELAVNQGAEKLKDNAARQAAAGDQPAIIVP